MRIILAEDERGIRKYLIEDINDVLCPERDTVEDVCSGGDLVKKVSDGQYDLIITDNGMPGISGIEAVEVIRGMGLNMPIWMFSGGDSSLKSYALSHGVNQFYEKPSDYSKILEDLKVLIDGL